MQYQHTCSGQSRVPSFVLAVLYQVVFVIVPFVVENISFPGSFERAKVFYFGVGVKHCRLNPSGVPPLKARVRRRCEAVVVVVSHAHYVPIARSVVNVVVSVVHVREAETVREFVANRANSGRIVAHSQFGTARVSVDVHAPDHRAHPEGVPEFILVRPDCVRVFGVGFPVSGVENVYLVSFSVAVPVVVVEVHLPLYAPAGLFYHLANPAGLVSSEYAVLPVISVAVRHRHRPGHVKVDCEPSVALRLEVVFHASCEIPFGKAFLVGYAPELFGRVLRLELHVVELHQYD